MQSTNDDNPKGKFGTIIKINVMLLLGTFFSACGWLIWPEIKQDFIGVILSVIFWMMALGHYKHAFKDMLALYKHDKALEVFNRKGTKPKSSTVASEDVLDKAGMR